MRSGYQLQRQGLLMLKYLRCIAVIILGINLTIGSARASDVVIGIPSWSSADATAHVLKELLSTRLGLDVAVKKGTNEEIFAGMDQGTIHVHPEVWLPNHKALHDKYVIRRKTAVLSEKGIPAEQGVCVTRQTAEQFGIHKIEDLSNPEKAKTFDTNQDGLGEMWIGNSDWSSTRIEKIRAKSYGHAKTMQLLEAQETVAMAAIDAAVAVNRPLAFFCYAPHHLFSLHEVVFLQEPPYSPLSWHIVDPTDDPLWLDHSQAAVAWPTSFLHIVYSTKLADAHPRAAKLLSAIKLDVDTVSAMTYAIVVDGIPAAAFAKQWVKVNSERIDAWVVAK